MKILNEVNTKRLAAANAVYVVDLTTGGAIVAQSGTPALSVALDAEVTFLSNTIYGGRVKQAQRQRCRPDVDLAARDTSARTIARDAQ
jgi:hypothetical protein